MKPTLFFVLLIISLHSFSQVQKYSKVKIFANDEELEVLAKTGIAVDNGELKKGIFLITDLSENEINLLDSKNFKYEILIDDVSKFYEERNAAFKDLKVDRTPGQEYPVPEDWDYGSMGGFCTLSETLDHLDNMRSQYPDLITEKAQIGNLTSIEGRPIYFVKISDNANINEDEPEVLYTALHHAREPISVQQMLFYMYYLLENYDTDSDIQNLVDNTEMYFVPCINPDGYVYNETTNPNGGGMWRKNRRDNGGGSFGVDPNRNYGYMWGYDNNGSSPDPWSETYRGTAPFSEPENQTIRDFCNEHEFKIALNYHSYGNLLLSPWGYIEDLCPDHDIFMSFAEMMTQDNNYTYGPGSTTIYPTNGSSDDWMYGEQDEKPKILSYTPEVGSGNDGFWPPISRIIPLCQENMLQNILAARLAGKYADIDDTSPLTTGDFTGFFSFSIQRLGLIDSTDFTVSIQPLGTEITEIGEPVVFSNLELLENDDDSISYSLDPSIQIGQEIKYLLSVDNDDFIVSDTITKIFGEAVIIFEDDGNTITNWSGGWGISNDQYHSPTGSITDSPYGNYNNNQTNSTTLTQEIDLTNSVFAVLNFWAIWEIEAGWDYVQVKISTNGGSSWEPLSGKYTKPGNNNQASGEPLYDGFQTSWVKEEMNLQDYLGETVKFRFTLKSDTWVTENGFHFDDLTVSVIDVFTSVDDLSGAPDITISNPIPNPANSTVRFNYLIPEKMDYAKLAIYNSAGQQTGVYDLKKNHNNIIISVADWNPGIYYYSIISSESRIKTKKLIVI